MIPNTIHFIYPVTERTRPWSLINHAAVMLARKYHPDHQINIWVNVKRPYQVFKTAITAALAGADLQFSDMPTENGGVEITWPQYMADVMRLQILQEHGGIYLDTDILLRMDIDGLRLSASEHNRLLLSWETAEHSSICNALMIAPPGNAFIGAWLDAMPEALKSPTWAQGGVVLPMELSKQDSLKDSRMILHHTLACPLDLSKPWLFDPNLRQEAKNRVGPAHAIHVFETYWRDIIKDIDPDWIERTPCLFSDILKEAVGGVYGD